ncbi:MAG: pectate lyase [Candidatus Binatia bacterium]
MQHKLHVVYFFAGVILVFLARSSLTQAEEQTLPPSIRTALGAMLQCERPTGGWMYACDRSERVAGFTKVMRRVERIAGAVGLATWDLIVLRSPGTPAAGLLLVRAHQLTHEEKYLDAARRTGDLLVNIQLPSGGWFSEMPVYSNQLAWWFRLVVPGTTLDDDVTSGAVRFLLALWETTGDTRYRDTATRALDLLQTAQLPSGAWPLTWRPAWRRVLSSSFEEWPSLNDAATVGPIYACIDGARSLRRPNLLEAAKRGGEWLIHARHPAPNAGWSQQYTPDGSPAPGRRFEPIGLATWESRHALEALQALAEATEEQRFCAPFPETVAWLQRSALSPGCWARLYSVDSNSPIYMDQQSNFVPTAKQAKHPYRWTGDFGIPAFFASLGLDENGDPRHDGAGLHISTWHLPGATSNCPGKSLERNERLHDLGPRARIAEAGSKLARLAPPRFSACAPRLLMEGHQE